MQHLQNAGFALLGMVMAAALVGLAALAIGRRRDVYLYGLMAAIVGFAGSVAVATMLLLAWPRLDPPLLMVWVGPALEEAARTTAIVMVSVALQQRRDWVLFGVGYGLLEASLKVGDALIIHKDSSVE